MQYVQGFLIFAIVLIVLGGCSGSPTEPTSEPTIPTTEPTTPEAYPVEPDDPEAYPAEPDTDTYPAPAAPESYPAPESDTSSNDTAAIEPFVVPTPSSAQLGNVTGSLLRIIEGETEPIAEATLYLGNVVRSEQGIEGLVELNRGVNPQTETTPQGEFVFTEVEPGRYGLMFDTATSGALLLNQPDTGSNLIVEVAGGEVVDLGRLEYQDLPE
jgi:hypothetical protein